MQAEGTLNKDVMKSGLDSLFVIQLSQYMYECMDKNSQLAQRPATHGDERV